MTTYVLAYSFNLKKISEIIKSENENKAENLFYLLSRDTIKNGDLKKELIWRLDRCLNNNILSLEKFWLYMRYPGPITSITFLPSGRDIKFLDGDDKIVGILHDEKWSGLASRELKKDELKYTIFNIWKAELSSDNLASSILYEQLKRIGCQYYFQKINETDNKAITKKSISEFNIIHHGNWIMNLNRISNFEIFSETVKKAWLEKIENTKWLDEEDKNRISGPLKLVENALKYGEDTICEEAG